MDKKYRKDNRMQIKVIYLNEPSLEGELDLGGFTKLEEVHIPNYLDETKLNIKNKGENAEIILTSSQKNLQQKFFTRQERKEVTKLYISSDIRDEENDASEKNLIEDLDLSNFVNLKELNCADNRHKLTSPNLNNCLQLEKTNCARNRLTSLNVSNCSHLTKLDCSDNLLISIILPNNLTNLKYLNLRNNNFLAQNLSFLIGAINLKELYLGTGTHGVSFWEKENSNKERINQGIYNKFTGSLDCLREMKQLKILDICNTDINEINTDKLPENLEEIYYSTEEKPDCKLSSIVPQLEIYE